MTTENTVVNPHEHPGVTTSVGPVAEPNAHADAAVQVAHTPRWKLLHDAIADTPPRGHELAVLMLYLEKGLRDTRT